VLALVCNPLGCVGVGATLVLVLLIVIIGGFGKNP
jgi:hypothetical protein